MFEALIGLVVTALQTYAAWQKASDADRAALEAQAWAAVGVLKGKAAENDAAHEARTAETVKIIEENEKK